jgi:hypothetical protein
VGDPDYVEANRIQLERMRNLIDRLGPEGLARPVNEDWTAAGLLAHIAFWDAHASFLAGRLERGEPFPDDEPEDVDWINDSTRPLIEAIEPVAAGRLAIRIAEDTDRRVAALPPERMYPIDESSPLDALRAYHRGEHLNQIETALDRGLPPRDRIGLEAKQ